MIMLSGSPFVVSLWAFFFLNIESGETDGIPNFMEVHGFGSGASTTYTSFHNDVVVK